MMMGGEVEINGMDSARGGVYRDLWFSFSPDLAIGVRKNTKKFIFWFDKLSNGLWNVS